MTRHNLVAHVLHWNRIYGLLAVASWFSHDPLPVVENSKVKTLWDFGMHTASPVSSNRPDMVVFLMDDGGKILLLEVSCPADVNVIDKEREKIAKYYSL